MWGCNFYSEIPFIGSLLPHGIISLIFWGILLFLILFFIIRVVKGDNGQNRSIANDRHDSLDILKIRYAKGEINSEEFKKIKQALL